jgi:hypothetical protein
MEDKAISKSEMANHAVGAQSFMPLVKITHRHLKVAQSV